MLSMGREHVPDTALDPRVANQHEGPRTRLAVPLMREGSAVGALGIARNDVRPFSDREIELVGTFADQAAIAIENVRPFNETKEALEQRTATAAGRRGG